jgi:hypothetical protein
MAAAEGSNKTPALSRNFACLGRNNVRCRLSGSTRIVIDFDLHAYLLAGGGI